MEIHFIAGTYQISSVASGIALFPKPAKLSP
jgi:hypothetical protein